MHRIRATLRPGLFALLLLPACHSAVYDIPVRDRDLTIDGDPGEWSGRFLPMEDSPIDIAVSSDDQAVYFCVILDGPALREQAMLEGLRLRFETGTGSVGLRMPVSPPRIDLEPEAPLDPLSDAPREDPSERHQRIVDARFEAGRERLEILRDGIPLRQVSSVELNGSDLAAAVTSTTFVLEGKLSLDTAADSLFALGVRPGEELRVHISTARTRIEHEQDRQLRSNLSSGGRPGHRPPLAPGPNPALLRQSKVLEFTARIRLAPLQSADASPELN